ncbi:MAG: TIM barrel protein [Chloroflexota bacterium]
MDEDELVGRPRARPDGRPVQPALRRAGGRRPGLGRDALAVGRLPGRRRALDPVRRAIAGAQGERADGGPARGGRDGGGPARLPAREPRPAGLASPAPARVCTELLNPVETPGYLLSSLAVVRSVLEPLGGRVAFQFDVYHLQRTRGEPIPAAAEMADLTGHVRVADAPGRNEPGTGGINVPNVLAALAANGYDGPVGLEYRPSGRTPDPFAWVEAAGYRLDQGRRSRAGPPVVCFRACPRPVAAHAGLHAPVRPHPRGDHLSHRHG